MAHSIVVYNESALEVAEKLYSEGCREPVALRRPAQVSVEDLAKHVRSMCVRARNREDSRPEVETTPEARADRWRCCAFHGLWILG